jgi:hypothetical protein
MSIKNTNKKALSTANLFVEQYRQKGLVPDIDIKADKLNVLAKDIQAIDDKVLPGYDCDYIAQKAWGDVWVNVWGNIGADINAANDEQDETMTTPSIKI